MDQGSRRDDDAPGRADLLRIFSPLLLFAAHAVYLAFWSTEPFMLRWIDGSFSFFVSLVLCNVVRARIAARSHALREHAAEPDGDDPRGDGPP